MLGGGAFAPPSSTTSMAEWIATVATTLADGCANVERLGAASLPTAFFSPAAARVLPSPSSHQGCFWDTH
jgi:hypothetical protein